MWKILISLILLIPCFAISCTTGPDEKEKINIEGKWEFEGLEQLEINSINEETSPILFSASNGIYSKNENGFLEFGLQDKPIVNVIQINESEYLAAVETFQLEGGDTTLYKSIDNGQNWVSFMSNFGGEDNQYTKINDLIIKEQGSSTFYACGGGNIARTENEGGSWSSVHLTWEHLGGALFVKTVPGNSDIIWAGGFNAILEPTLKRSTDGGDNWERLTVLENVEADNNDLILNDQDSEDIMIGLSGSAPSANIIRRSLDNGETWSTVYEGAGIYTLTHSARNPEITYASGITTERRLFFIATADFGDTWQTIEYPESHSGVYVNDMVSVMEGDQEIIYLGTNMGLYSFTVEGS